MRDNVSIIFATIILTFLIVILPMFSILDRQDSMSYNLVLSETTKFVDDVRSNGFITEEDYLNYVTSLSATGNTYKVVLEAYRKTLIPNASGSYDEVKKLYNTQDVVDIITGERGDEEQKEANRRDNIFIFDINDEFYVHVYNTNMTAGSMMYNMIVDNVNSKVIDVTYGGLVNNVNWELYTKLKNETIVQPTVALSVPTNLEGKFNIIQTSEKGDLANLQCAEISGLDDLFAGAYELCTDIIKDEIYKYQYYLDEKNDAGEYINKTINIFAELRGVDLLDVAKTANTTEYTEIEKVYNRRDKVYGDTNIEKAIVEKYIHLNGMTAEKIDIVDFKKYNNRYYLQIRLTGVDRESQANFSQIASISILPGLGKNKEHELTTGAESVKLELTIKGGEIEAAISGPYNWKKFLKTNIIEEAAIPYVFANEEIFYKVHFSEATNFTAQEVKELLNNRSRNAIIFKYRASSGAEATQNKNVLELECYTAAEMLEKGVVTEEDAVVVKVKYPASAVNTINEIILTSGWLTGMVQTTTSGFMVYKDELGPNKPVVDYEGILGDNNWYVSDINIVTYPTTDRGNDKNAAGETIYSGIYRNLLSITGPLTLNNVEDTSEIILTEDGEYEVSVKTEDYTGRYSENVTEIVKIDKTPPTKPKFKIEGKTGSKGATSWYIDDPVKVTITTDTSTAGSGIDRNTYRIQGAKTVYDTKFNSGKTIILDESGIYRITATTYDGAGNSSTETVTIKLDRGAPPVATIEVLRGLKHDDDNDWYYTDVKLRIHVNITIDDTHSDKSKYILYKDGIKIKEEEFLGTIKDLEITEGTGEYKLDIYTYTVANPDSDPQISTHIIKIDKDGPNVPKIIINGTAGNEGWYASDVTVKLNETDFSYKYTYEIINMDTGNTESSGEFTAANNQVAITAVEGKRCNFILTSTDSAGNATIYEQEIAIDKVKPTGEVVLTGSGQTPNIYSEEIDDLKVYYYNSPVYVGYKNASDSYSGVGEVVISDEVIDTTDGTILEKEVTVTIYDKAGNSQEYKQKVVIDKKLPDNADLDLTGTEASVDNITGVDSYVSDVVLNITPGADDNFQKAEYEITGPEDFGEKTGTLTTSNKSGDITLNKNGFYTITVKTYDKSGNVSIVTKAIYINKYKPDKPEILMVNDTYIGGKSYTISGGVIINIEVVPTVIGSVTVTISNSAGTKIIERTFDANGSNINFMFDLGRRRPGTYYISATQKNLAGVSSDSSNTVTYVYTK